MIQRLQSVWLLIASILAFLTLKISFFSGNILVNTIPTLQKFTAMNNMFLMILTVVIAVGSLITIFLFRNRKLQVKIAVVLLVLSLLDIFIYYRSAQTFDPVGLSYNLTAIATLAIPIFLILAIRGIRKDDKLIKSVDRLR